MGHSDFLPPVIGAFGCPSATATTSAPPVVRSQRIAAPHPRARAFPEVARNPSPVSVEATGPPRFLGSPCVHMPRSFDPGGTVVARPVQRHRAAFRNTDCVGSHKEARFEAQSRGLRTRGLRSTSLVTQRRVRLATGWWPTFAGRELHPLNSKRHFRITHRRSFPSDQALPGAPACEPQGRVDRVSRLAASLVWPARRRTRVVIAIRSARRCSCRGCNLETVRGIPRPWHSCCIGSRHRRPDTAPPSRRAATKAGSPTPPRSGYPWRP